MYIDLNVHCVQMYQAKATTLLSLNTADNNKSLLWSSPFPLKPQVKMCLRSQYI